MLGGIRTNVLQKGLQRASKRIFRSESDLGASPSTSSSIRYEQIYAHYHLKHGIIRFGFLPKLMFQFVAYIGLSPHLDDLFTFTDKNTNDFDHNCRSKSLVVARKSNFAGRTVSARFCSTESIPKDSNGQNPNGAEEDRFKRGWYRYLPRGVEASKVAVVTPELQKQFELCTENPGNRHLRYDLVTLCLRSLRLPLTDDYETSSILLGVSAEMLTQLSGAEKFKTQLSQQLEKHMTAIQRLDIRTKIGEHKAKLQANGWSSVPVMAAYAHFLMLDAQLAPALQVVNRASSLTQSLLYFQLGTQLEAEASQLLQTIAPATADSAASDIDKSSEIEEKANNIFYDAALMYCRSLKRNAVNTESLTNLALLEWYKRVDTTKAMIEVEEEEEKRKVRSKGYNPPTKKRENAIKNRTPLKRSLELLEKALTTDVTNSNYLAYYHLAFLLETEVGTEAIERARQLYSKALEINPDHLQSHSHLGSLLMEEKMYDKALHHYEQAKLLAPDQILVYLNLANCLGRLGSVEAAMTEMQRAIRREPTMPQLHYHLGMILLRANRLEEACASFERAIQLHGLFPHAHGFDPAPTYNTMISILRQLAARTMDEGDTVEEFEEAAQHLARCLDLLPDASSLHPTILLNLCFCLMKSNRPEAALQALQDADEFAAKNGEISSENGDQVSKNIQPLDIAQLFREVQQSNSNPIVYTQLEQHFTSMEHTDAMIHYLMKKIGEVENPDLFVPEQSEIVEKKIGTGVKESSKLKKRKTATKKVKKTKTKKMQVSELDDMDDIGEDSLRKEIEDEEAIDPEIEEAIRKEIDDNREEQMKMLLAYKAKLHYNVAFCMNYLGEYEELKRHLRLAVETDPECTSDYIVFEAPKPEEEPIPEEDEEVEDPNLEIPEEDMEIVESMGQDSMRNRDDDDEEEEEVGIKDLLKKTARTSSSIRRASRALPYTQAGLEYQLENLIHPPDGSKMTPATAKFLEFLEQSQEKYKHVSLDQIDLELTKKHNSTGSRAVRSEKSKRRRKLKYTVEASKRVSRLGGPDDGFDSPL